MRKVIEAVKSKYIYKSNTYTNQDYFDTEDEAMKFVNREHLRKYDIHISDDDVILYYNE